MVAKVVKPARSSADKQASEISLGCESGSALASCQLQDKLNGESSLTCPLPWRRNKRPTTDLLTLSSKRWTSFATPLLHRLNSTGRLFCAASSVVAIEAVGRISISSLHAVSNSSHTEGFYVLWLQRCSPVTWEAAGIRSN